MADKDLEQALAVIQLCKDLLEHKKRDTKLLFIALIISILTNLFTIAAFLWYESQWEFTDTVTTTTEQSIEGEGNIVNGDQYTDFSRNSGGN